MKDSEVIIHIWANLSIVIHLCAFEMNLIHTQKTIKNTNSSQMNQDLQKHVDSFICDFDDENTIKQ